MLRFKIVPSSHSFQVFMFELFFTDFQKAIQKINIFMTLWQRWNGVWYNEKKRYFKTGADLEVECTALYSRGPWIKFLWYLLEIFLGLKNFMFGMAVGSDAVSGWETQKVIRFSPSLSRFSCPTVVSCTLSGKDFPSLPAFERVAKDWVEHSASAWTLVVPWSY